MSAVLQYDNLTFKWASTLVGFIAAAFATIPFFMFRCTRGLPSSWLT